MANLPTNFVDDVLDTTQNTNRVFDLVDQNGQTVLSGLSLVDRTHYTTQGSNLGAAQINATNAAVNKNTKNVSWYGTCSTAAATTAKVATTSDTAFALATGAKVKIKFTNANTASAPTLNVDSKGAKAIKAFGTTAPTSWWKAGDIVEFTYDGTNWIMGASQGEIEQINNNLSDKVGGQITNYTSVENLAYDGTNKKIMLKVEGADTPIPFSNEIQSATQVASGDRTLSASCKKGEVFVATGAKYGGVITYANAQVLWEYNTGSFGTAVVKAQADGTITVGNWYGASYMRKLNI